MNIFKKKKPIYLYDDEESLTIDGPMPFACTNKFFAKCTDLGIDSKELIMSLVFQKVFLVTSQKENEYFQILSEKAVLACVLDEKGHFIITSVIPKTVEMQNKFIKSALKIRAELGAILWTGSNQEWSNKLVSRSQATSQFSMVKHRFLQRMSALNTTNVSEETGEDYQISGEFEELLSIADYYSIAEDEVQKAQAQSGQQIMYYEFSAADDFDRIEKIAYDFLLTDIDQTTYKKGTRVVIHLDGQAEASGVITELCLEEDEPYKMTVLFDELFQVDTMLPAGIISLEYNSVQLEVRQGVIEDLRNGTSPAKYLDDVLGNDSFADFTKKDLDELMKDLQSSDRPPNESQLDAIKRGIETNDALLVLGPPGTGKTTVILEWVKHFVLKEEKRVLISSQNNKAVDNVLERLAQEQDIDTIRVGSEEKVQTNVQHLMYEQRAFELQKNIIEANEKFTGETEKQLKAIEAFVSKLTTAVDIAEAFQSSYEKMTSQYTRLKERFIVPLTKLHEKDTNHKERLQYLKMRVKEQQENLTAYNESEWWKKLVTFPRPLLAKRAISKLKDEHDTLFFENQEVVSNYNKLVTEAEVFRLEEVNTVKESFSVLRNAWEKAKQTIGELHSTDVTGENVSFSVTSIADESAAKQIEEMKRGCEAVYDRISIIDGSLKRWRGFLEVKKNYALSKVLLESVDLVGATCIGINSQRRFRDLDFDVTIIDEAGQIQIQNAIVPISRSKKVIMLGDHLQIPPIADEKVMARCKEARIDTTLLPMSFFEYLYNRFREENKILLDTQYRMPAEIAEVLSEWFYEGKYRSFKGKMNLQTPFPNLFTHPFVLVDTGKDKGRYETQKPGEGYYNELEADLVVKLLKEIVADLNVEKVIHDGMVSISDVGVITPYKQQVKFIREKVMEAFPYLKKDQVADLVASLDSFQGQERKVIIYSCTRSNRKKPDQPRIGFLKELRRLNVALSRCQKQLVFIGDVPFLSSCEFIQKDEDGELLLDEEGNPLPGTSEKEFSQFIQLMKRAANQGMAQHIDASILPFKNNLEEEAAGHDYAEEKALR